MSSTSQTGDVGDLDGWISSLFEGQHQYLREAAIAKLCRKPRDILIEEPNVQHVKYSPITVSPTLYSLFLSLSLYLSVSVCICLVFFFFSCFVVRLGLW